MVERKRETRKQLIAIAQRRQRPGSGTSVATLRERTARMQVPDLAPVLKDLPWAVVGAVATRLYMPERVTQDLDIAVRLEDREEVRRRLKEAGFSHQGDLSIGGSSWRSRDGFPVDVVELDAPWADEALAVAAENRDLQGLPVLPLPYLALMKFEAGRVQDLADVTRMLGQADAETLDAVRRLFSQYLPEDSEDLESLIALGKLEMEPRSTDDDRRA